MGTDPRRNRRNGLPKIDFAFQKAKGITNTHTKTMDAILAQTHTSHNKSVAKSGYLELWLGPMFSGKTTRLIDAYKKHTFIGKHVVVINYTADKRYHETMLSTHDKVMIPCVQTESLSEFGVTEAMAEADVVLINEGQFFADLYDIVANLVDIQKKTVFIAALDGDFRRNKFGRVLDLIPLCDRVTKLVALCSRCRDGTEAVFSKRISKESEQVVIGADNYMPLCRGCYLRA